MNSQDDNYSPFTKMSGDQPNPLRPYYIPPSIGPSQPIPNATAPGYTPNTRAPSAGSSNKGLTDLFSDLDYGDYLGSSPSTAQLVKEKLDQAIWNYTSVLLAQPFEVAKVVLQCHDAGAMTPEGAEGGLERRITGRAHDYTFSDSDSDSEAPSYFTQTSADETPSHRPRRRNASRTHSTTSTNPPSTQPSTLRLLQTDSIIEVIQQLWSREGAFGVWKGTNSTFAYGVLLKTIETWTRSCLSAILDIPDPMLFNAALGIKSYNGPTILDSPSPITSLSVVIVAAAVAGCLLAPVDLVRTKLLLTPASSTPRAILPSLKALPTISCPPEILPITILHSSLPTFIGHSMPIFFRQWLRIDPIHTPGAYSVTSFLTSLTELFVKLPLETVLRRGHVSVLNDANNAQPSRRPANLLPIHTTGLANSKFKPIVPSGPYRGVIGSILYIVYEEGRTASSIPSTPSRASSSLSNRRSENLRRPVGEKRGQGLAGLWRGWRVGFWGIVGMYAAAGLGGGPSGGEF